MRRVGTLFAAISSTAHASVNLDEDVEGAMLLQMRSTQKQAPGVVALMGGDAAALCGSAQELDFSTVKNNNLDGSEDGPATIHYGGVITKEDGTVVDLVVRSDSYKSMKGNSKNGANHNGVGMLNLDCNSQNEFVFNFVDAATGGSVLPTPIGGNVLLNFMDIDQGRRTHGREQVMLCGVTDALVSADSELEKIVMDDCATVTSGARGTAADNPNTQQLSPLQKARAAAFFIGAESSIDITISVGQCFGNRGVMFGGKAAALCPPAPVAPQVYTPPLAVATQPPVAIETTPAPIIHVDPVPTQPPLAVGTQAPVAVETTPAPIIHVDPVPTQPPLAVGTQAPVAVETTPAPIIHVDPVPTPAPTEEEEEEEILDEEEGEEIEDTEGFCPAHRCGRQFGKACCVKRNGSATRTDRPNNQKKRNCVRNRNVWCRIGTGLAKKREVNIASFA